MKEMRDKLLLLGAFRNINLRHELIEGAITPEEFATKDVADFQADELKQMMQKGQDWFMKAVQSDFYIKNSSFKEGEITCYKCKNKKIYTTQKQMRCADEPMTT